MVGECSICYEAKGVSHGGAYRSKNVGTSNRKEGENPSRRKTKGSISMLVKDGLVGPKPMAKAEGDGYRVNIP